MPYRARRVATAFSALALAALLAGCQRDATAAPTDGNTHGFVPPPQVPARPLPGQTPLTSLDAYLGHDPREPIDGVEFFDRTDVSTALIAAVKDERVRREFRESPGPVVRAIFARGERIGAWGCGGQDCARHSWTFLLDRRTGKGEACIHDAAMGAKSHWYSGAGKPVARGGTCPTS